MGRARMRVSSHLIHQMFSLPSSAVVLGSLACDEPAGYVDIVVESPDIPEAEDQQVTPLFRKQPEVVFEGWNPAMPAKAETA